MVDCTLDDYIGQKGTFSVQLPSKSVNVGSSFGVTGGFQRNNVRGGFQRNLNLRGGFQKKMNVRGGFQQNGSNRGFQSTNNRGGFQRGTNLRGGFQRGTNLRGGFQRNTNVRGGFHGTANNGSTNFAITGLGNVKSFDARLRLGPKVTFDARQKLQKKSADVRQKIAGPGSNIIKLKSPTSQNLQNVLGANKNFNMGQSRPAGAGNNTNQLKQIFKKITAPETDARSKILKIQIKKGTFDARSLITSKGGDSQVDSSTSQKPAPQGVSQVGAMTRNIPMNQPSVDTGAGLLTKTVTNVTSDNCIMVTNTGLQVTRSVPASSITFDGSSLKVTKRAHTIESSDSTSIVNKAPTGIIKLSQSQYSKVSSVSTTVGNDESDDNDMEDGTYPMNLNITRTANFSKSVTSSPMSMWTEVTQTPSPQPVVRSSQSALKTSQPVLKRKSTAPVVSGPLKLLKTGDSSYTPSLRVPSISKPAAVTVKSERSMPVVRKAKPAVTSLDEDVDTTGDVVNPLQGYRVYVTNLHPIVNQDDIIELFGAIGALKKAKLIKQGVAEVVYLNKDDAQKAVVKYNNRELDGQVMMVKLLTSAPAAVKKPAPPVAVPVEDPDRGEDSSPIESKGQPLKLRKQVPVSSLGPESSNVQLPVLHKALFKLGGPTTTNPVTFTVKI